MKNVKKTWVVLALLGCMQVLHAQTVYLHSDNPQMKWKLKPQAEVGTDVKSLCGNGYNVSAWVDAVVPGTVAASKAVVVDSNKDISSFRNLTASSTVTSATGIFNSTTETSSRR